MRNEADFARCFAAKRNAHFASDFAQGRTATNDLARVYRKRRKNETQNAHTPHTPSNARGPEGPARWAGVRVCAGISLGTCAASCAHAHTGAFRARRVGPGEVAYHAATRTRRARTVRVVWGRRERSIQQHSNRYSSVTALRRRAGTSRQDRQSLFQVSDLPAATFAAQAGIFRR